MGKIKVTLPTVPKVTDVTSPKAMRKIWVEAERVTRSEAPVMRARSRRIRKLISGEEASLSGRVAEALRLGTAHREGP